MGDNGAEHQVSENDVGSWTGDLTVVLLNHRGAEAGTVQVQVMRDTVRFSQAGREYAIILRDVLRRWVIRPDLTLAVDDVRLANTCGFSELTIIRSVSHPGDRYRVATRSIADLVRVL